MALRDMSSTSSPTREAVSIQSAPPRPSLRETYPGAILFNLITIFLPALYGTLSKLWIAQLASSQVVTTDIYTYVGIFAEIVNEGYSRAAWYIIGDKRNRSVRERLNLSFTLIAVQVVLGTLLMVIFLIASPAFASAFVPEEVRSTSIGYVRISAVSTLFSVLEYAVTTTTRSFDRPDVPLIITLVKVSANIVLDLLFLSTVRVWKGTPTVNMQGGLRLGCDAAGAFVGLGYFFFTAHKHLRQAEHEAVATSEDTTTETYVSDNTQPDSYATTSPYTPTLRSLRTLTPTATFTLLETALRNGLYLWQVSSIVALGADYATAWGVFNTIRWGVLMVPASAFEAATLAFTAHNWGVWRKKQEDGEELTKKDLITVLNPALKSTLLTLLTELLLCLLLSLFLIRPFAFYLSSSASVATLVTTMFHHLDWCYILWTTTNNLTAVLLATWPTIWFYNSVVVNVGWVVPWCVVIWIRREWA
ncbi:hypothetical protein HK097_007093, partial [Rhizophlyctis rosea]